MAPTRGIAVVGTSDISIEVDGDRLIATLPGTAFTTSYLRPANGGGLLQGPVTIEDSSAPVSRDEFEALAWEAAYQKARDLGWVA